jgi:lipoprotein signal peptidase
MNMGIGDIRTGIFNVADIFVTSGVIGLLLFYKDKNKTDIETGQVPVE